MITHAYRIIYSGKFYRFRTAHSRRVTAYLRAPSIPFDGSLYDIIETRLVGVKNVKKKKNVLIVRRDVKGRVPNRQKYFQLTISIGIHVTTTKAGVKGRKRGQARANFRGLVLFGTLQSRYSTSFTLVAKKLKNNTFRYLKQ